MGLGTIKVYKYNNYYNRRVKQGKPPDAAMVFNETAVNFNPNDGIDTTYVVGRQTNAYYGSGDYMVFVADDGSETAAWFIVESERLRNGQYKLYLHRDVIHDYYSEVIVSPVFIEKATLPDDNPLIFNPENMTYNQIKTDEWLLKDYTGVAWAVGYYDKTKEFKGNLASVSVKGIGEQLNTPIMGWEYYKYVNENYKVYSPDTMSFKIRFKVDGNNTLGYYKVTKNSKSNRFDDGTTGDVGYHNTYEILNEYITTMVTEFKRSWTQLTSNVINYYRGTYFHSNHLADLLAYNGKLIQDNTGKVFSVRIEQQSGSTEEADILGGSNLFETLKTTVSRIRGINESLVLFPNQTPTGETFKFVPKLDNYRVVLEEQTQYQGTYDLAAAKITQDAPYNIFCIPYGDITVGTVQMTKSQTFSIVNEIIKEQSSEDKLYDVQLLPYCPLQDLDVDGNTINLPSDTSLYSAIKDADQKAVGYIFNAPFGKFNFTLSKLNNKDVDLALPPMDETKIESECSFYRLCSPNYNGQFEFNRAKNGGLSFFKIDCTYKPFTPYIRVAPNFGGLYGREFDDPRGLICGGDFGLPIINNAWISYQAQNKNYQNIFNRQIENMEITQKYQRRQEIAGMITGGLSTGAMVGGVAKAFGTGAGVGVGLAGAAASIGGGLADLAINDRLRAEALDYTKDLFGYQLGNIQALPDSLTRVDSFTNNNKIFPVLEYYTCTDVEKDALRDKIKYNGMSVGVVGKIVDYLSSYEHYIKCKLIRFENGLGEDFHAVKAISDELYKGVFI